MGSFIFANQYKNEIIPDEEKKFKKEWLRYYKLLPQVSYRFAFIDPAFAQHRHSDYTGIAVVYVDPDGIWYLRLAQHYKLTPTEIVNKCFDLCDQFKLDCIGVEGVAYQEALIYLISEEMQKRKKMIPLKGLMKQKGSKESRILALVPRFEWGRILLAPGQNDFEDELDSFPRGTHDDILDALASLEEIVYYPEREKDIIEQPHSPNDPNYEKWYINQLTKNASHRGERQGSFADEFGL